MAALVAAIALLLTDWPLRCEIAAIRFYRAHLSPIVAYTAHCRFQPTCSAYGLLVLERDGFWKGNAELGLRLLRCSAPGYLVDYLRGAQRPAAATATGEVAKVPATRPTGGGGAQERDRE
ncbi:MAG: hypothetical protein Kow00109_24990 [Acidobacteriota bacterium]